MKERDIRKKAIKILEKKGYICWYPAKVKFKENDIFGCFDMVCGWKHLIRWLQLTSVKNIRAREKKVRKVMKETGIKFNAGTMSAEIWGIRKDKSFKIIRI